MTNDNPWVQASKKSATKTRYARGSITEKRAGRIRLYMKISAVIVPISLVLLVLLVFGMVKNQAEPVPATHEMSQDEIEGRSIAIQTVAAYISQDPAPLPSGQLVGWDKVERAPMLANTVSKNKTQQTYPVDVHTLTVVAADTGQLFHANVQIVITPAGPIVQGTPSLSPYVPVNERSDIPDWPKNNFPQHVDQKKIASAVQAWADAYMSGDSERLHHVVGDPNPEHTYVPMPPAFVEASLESMSTLTTPQDKDKAPARIIARVGLAPTWPVDDDSQARPAAPMTFDVLIEKANTGSPIVVAWGGAGSGPGLKKYGNAVTGVVVDVLDSELSGDTPTDDTDDSPSDKPGDTTDTGKTVQQEKA